MSLHDKMCGYTLGCVSVGFASGMSTKLRGIVQLSDWSELGVLKTVPINSAAPTSAYEADFHAHALRRESKFCCFPR